MNRAAPQTSPVEGERVLARISSRLRALYQWETWQPLVQPLSWLLLAGLALPWFGYVQWRYPVFFHFFIMEQHFGRFLTPAIHPEPVYYYGPVLLGLLLPWSFLLPWVWLRRPRDPDQVFLMIWAGVVVAFFSLSRGKLAPLHSAGRAAPGPAAGAGSGGSGGERPGRAARTGFQHQPVGVGRRRVAPVYSAFFLNPKPGLAEPQPGAALFVSGGHGFHPDPSFCPAGPASGPPFFGSRGPDFSILLPVGMERLSRERSPREMGRLLKSLWQPHAALVGVYLYSQGLSFYSGQVFHLVEFRTELDFGRKLAPEQERRLCLTGVGDLVNFVQNRPLVFLYMKERYLEGLETRLPGKLRLLNRQGDCLLLAYEGK